MRLGPRNWSNGGVPPGASLGLRRAAPVRGALAFTLAMLPAPSIPLDIDPAFGITKDGSDRVSQWAARVGGLTFAQATNAKKGLYSSVAWGNGIPTVSGDGASDGTVMTADGNPAIDKAWIFTVARRGTTNTSATSTERTLSIFGRATDGLSVELTAARPGADATQRSIRVNAIGNTLTVGASGGWGVGEKNIIVQELALGSQKIAVSGNPISSAATPNGTATRAAMELFGDTGGGVVQDRLGADIARILAVDYTKLPGGIEQQYNRYLIEGALASTYGIDKSGWPSTHPFKSRAPLATDYGENRLIQTWGNSIGNGLSAYIAAGFSFDYTATGYGVRNGCRGGYTWAQILSAFEAGNDVGGLTSSGIGTTAQRQKITLVGEWAQNGEGSGGNFITGLATMVAAIEAEQGVAAGQGRIVIMQPWLSWSATIGSSERTARLALWDQVKAAYPNYALNTSEQFIALGAPGGAYADPTNYAQGIPPAALQTSGDLTHPNSLGYSVLGAMVAAFIEAKGWVS